MKTLRCLSLTLIMCYLYGGANAQYVTIPDPVFVAYLQQNFSMCMNGNQLDTTCNPVTAVGAVGINNLGIKDLTGIQYFDGLDLLECRYDSLTFLPPLPPNLTRLRCAYNQITTLPTLPAGLTELDFMNNNLTSVPPLPAGLIKLNCSFNNIATLPAWPATLQELNIYNLPITSIPALPAGLTSLDCRNSNMTALPALPASLIFLSCGSYSLTSLPALPNGLRYLVCGGTSLTGLPSPLPDSLQTITCGFANISSIPLLPLGLKELYVQNTLLTSLPPLPAGLTKLDCGLNHITSLPALPQGLLQVRCYNNNLTALPVLPDTMDALDCSGNPNLLCLPHLTYINSLRFDGGVVTCLPNYGNVRYSVPSLNSLPLCDTAYNSNCQAYWNIAGTIYNDISADCIRQQGETSVPFVKVSLLQNGAVVQQGYSAGAGVYSFETLAGSYTLTVDSTGVPLDILCPVSRYNQATVAAPSAQVSNVDFALQCKPGFDVGVWSIAPAFIFRPAAYTHVRVAAGDLVSIYRRSCNTLNLSGQLTTTINGPVTYIGPGPGGLTPSSIVGNVLTYNISNWAAVNVDSAFSIILQTDTTAPLGAQVCFEVNVTPTAGDNNTANNHLTYCGTVVNSFDPNIKEVYPVSQLAIDDSRWLTYTVRFQNTGNAPAENIAILDTLDSALDETTFQLLAYSFAPKVYLNGSAVRFNFANINLPDSLHDEPNSHGYVQYKVKAKDDASVGTHISNTAYIYFDYNAPVVTNTTNTLLVMHEGINTPIATATMQVYPNPANDVVMINLSDNLSGGTLTLYDITGRRLLAIPTTISHNQLNTEALSSGVYLLTATKGSVQVVQRLVIGK